MGISDIIAGFIQQELEEAGGALELQRSDLAQRFNCVPSQINYVMSTRFSPEHGYIVESRRRHAGLRQRPGQHPESGGFRGRQPGAGAGAAGRRRRAGAAHRSQGAAQRAAGRYFQTDPDPFGLIFQQGGYDYEM